MSTRCEIGLVEADGSVKVIYKIMKTDTSSVWQMQVKT